MLQLTYDIGDILEYTDGISGSTYTLLVESVDGSTFELNGYPHTRAKLTNMTNGQKLHTAIPKYLGRSGDIVINRLA